MTIAIARPSATTVVVREDGEGLSVLLVQRSPALTFHGGEWVFPGGRVDPEDAGELPLDSIEAARRTAAREAEEEAGIHLDEAALVPIAHWTTPEVLPKRFATWFFLAPVDPAEVRVDGGEIHAFRWMRPAEALRARDAGELPLPPPTFVTLLELSRFSSLDEAIASYRERPAPRYFPRPVIVDGVVCNLVEGDAGYEDGDGERPGPRHRVVMDPEGWRYERS